MIKSSVLMLILGMVGCASTEYVGETYTPTTSVDVFMNENDVQKPYKVMGKAETEATEYMSFEDMQEQLKVDAMSKGADGIIITGMKTISVGSSSYTTGKTSSEPEMYATIDGELHVKNASDGTFSAVTTNVQIRDHVLSADLIKYTD
jgi:hypothetical protein